MLHRLKLNHPMSSKILMRHFTTKKPVPNPKPDSDPDPLIVGILICLGVGQYLKFIEYKDKYK
jgi:hypothetical protein